MSTAHGTNPMNTTHNAETKRLIATLGVAAAYAVAPALLFGSGVAAGPQPTRLPM
jgi:hypothetical protein